tara:strand:+ start:178 stop:534 length:357 start_codon:yes stop_codon:yes gene_type:complete
VKLKKISKKLETRYTPTISFIEYVLREKPISIMPGMLHINIKGCLKIIVTIMLKNPFNAKQPNNQTETFSMSILLLLVIDSIIAIGPEMAKRKAIKPSTKLFIEIFCINALYILFIIL